jgi:hypothetical protein
MADACFSKCRRRKNATAEDAEGAEVQAMRGVFTEGFLVCRTPERKGRKDKTANAVFSGPLRRQFSSFISGMNSIKYAAL